MVMIMAYFVYLLILGLDDYIKKWVDRLVCWCSHNCCCRCCKHGTDDEKVIISAENQHIRTYDSMPESGIAQNGDELSLSQKVKDTSSFESSGFVNIEEWTKNENIDEEKKMHSGFGLSSHSDGSHDLEAGSQKHNISGRC